MQMYERIIAHEAEETYDWLFSNYLINAVAPKTFTKFVFVFSSKMNFSFYNWKKYFLLYFYGLRA